MSLAKLTVKIGADISELEKAMGRASKAMEETGKRMSDLGKTLSTRVTAPLVAMGALSVRAFGIQEKAELQLRAALQANGREVDKLFGRYSAFASEMQRVTVVGDETTLAMLAQAESFGLSADNAERAVKNSIAMQSAFGVNAQSALRYTAALEQGNATMLTRYIPSLRDITDESEKVAEAQRILGNAFSSAEAEAQGSAGQITQLKNAFGDLMEVVGGVIAEAIMPFIKRAKQMAEQLQTIDREILKTVVGYGALVAAIGPAMLIIGKFTKVLGLLLSPLALKLAAIVALGVGINWLIQNIPALAERFKFYFSKAKDAVLDMVSASIRALAKLIGFVNKATEIALTGLAVALEEAKDGLDKPEFTEFTGIIEALGNSFAFVTDMIKDFIFAGSGANKIAEEFKRTIEAMDMPTRSFGMAIENISVQANKIPQSMQDAFESIKKKQIALEVITPIMDNFVNSFGHGMANVVVQGERLVDVLKNIGKLLLSSAIQRGLQLLLSGGLSSGGFFGSGGGLLGSLFGSVTSVNDALITSGGNVVKFHPNDSILAMKDFSQLGGMGSQKVEVFGKISGQDIFISSDRGGSSFNR
jgi:hypothetical protein